MRENCRIILRSRIFRQQPGRINLRCPANLSDAFFRFLLPPHHILCFELVLRTRIRLLQIFEICVGNVQKILQAIALLERRFHHGEFLARQRAQAAQYVKMIQQPLAPTPAGIGAASEDPAHPCCSVQSEAIRLPLSTLETTAGVSGASDRVSYQFSKWPRCRGNFKTVSSVRRVCCANSGTVR